MSYTRSANLGTSLIHHSKWLVIDHLYAEAKRVSQLYLQRLPRGNIVGTFAEKALYDLVPVEESWLSATVRQQCCKFAKGTLLSIQTRKEHLQEIQDGQDPTTESSIRRAIVIAKLSEAEPELINFSHNLYGQAVNFSLNSATTRHQNWVKLGCLGKGIKLSLPFKKTLSFKKCEQRGKLSKFVQIRANRTIKCVFKLKPEPVPAGTTAGCDIGMRRVYTMDNGSKSHSNNIGRNYLNLAKKVKRAGKAKCRSRFRRECDCFANWAINRLDLAGIKCLKLENISTKSGAGITAAWRPSHILGQIEAKCQEAGVKVVYVSAPYTSQRCYECGWTAKANRPNGGVMFTCRACAHTDNADLNAAKNIAAEHPKFKYRRPAGMAGGYITSSMWQFNRSN